MVHRALHNNNCERARVDNVVVHDARCNHNKHVSQMDLQNCFEEAMPLTSSLCNSRTLDSNMLDKDVTDNGTLLVKAQDEVKIQRKSESDDRDPDFSDLDTGWAWVVLVACTLAFTMSGGSMYNVGIMHNALLERFRSSVAKTAWAGSLHTGLSLAGKHINALVL